MKKLSLTAIVLAFFVTFMFCACGGGSSKGPANISMKLWEQVQKENYKKAAEIWYDNADLGDNAPDAEKIAALSSKMEESRANQPKITNVKMVKEEIDEELGKASVTVLITYDDGNEEEETDKYKKVDGTWKIDASAK